MSDRKLLLILGGAMVLVLLGVGLLVPAATPEDPSPTTYNTTSAGTKAALLTLQAMGRKADRWERSPGELTDVDAARTTLVVTKPMLTREQEKDVAAALKGFMERGGRVLVADAPGELLPGGKSSAPSLFQAGLCVTTPEGPDTLAAAGPVEMAETARWSAKGPVFRVSQRCGHDAVVVRYPVGDKGGEAVWWSSATPMSNAGLKNDANLRLLLASLDGDGFRGDRNDVLRNILFDEYLHSEHGETNPVKGLPLGWLALQLGLIVVLLVLSFSRRKGPLRMPVTVPRSSPVEFAVSMGDLYRKAGATAAATKAAERRLEAMLLREVGMPRATVLDGPRAVAEVLTLRVGGDWTMLAEHLQKAREVAGDAIAPQSALALVRAMAEDEEQLRRALRPGGRGMVVVG